jgi:hypothetical protein
MAKQKTKKKSKPKNTGVVTITISRACAEELYIAIANALTSELGKRKKGSGGGGKGGGFGPFAALSGLPGHDDTGGHD